MYHHDDIIWSVSKNDSEFILLLSLMVLSSSESRWCLGIELAVMILPTSKYSWLSLGSSDSDTSWQHVESSLYIFRFSCISMFVKNAYIFSMSDMQYCNSSKQRSCISVSSIKRRCSATGMRSIAWRAYEWSEAQKGEFMLNTSWIVVWSELQWLLYSLRSSFAFFVHNAMSFDTRWACFWPPEYVVCVYTY